MQWLSELHIDLRSKPLHQWIFLLVVGHSDAVSAVEVGTPRVAAVTTSGFGELAQIRDRVGLMTEIASFGGSDICTVLECAASECQENEGDDMPVLHGPGEKRPDLGHVVS
ncbi:hypothetical protein D3C85_1309420 [compost metagenome]